MSKVRIVGLKSERSLILNVLERSRCFEVSPTKEISGGEKINDTSHLDRITGLQSRVAFAIEFTEKMNEEAAQAVSSDIKRQKKDKDFSPRVFGSEPVKIKRSRSIMGCDDFYDIAAKEYELINVTDELEKISFERVEIRSKINKVNAFIKSLKPYENAGVKFSALTETKTAFAALALGPSGVVNPIKDADAFIEEYPSSGAVLLGIVAKKADKPLILEQLSRAGFSLCGFTFDNTAAELIKNSGDELIRLNKMLDERLDTALEYTKYVGELKALYDIYGLEIEKCRYEFDFVKTYSTFVLEGWTPKDKAEKITDLIKSKTDKAITYILEPEEGDEPPTLLKNNKLFSIFEDTTNLYSPPAYKEYDPNPFMAVFFFVIFGLMIGDAGYGIILTLACLIGAAKFKLEKGVRNMMLLFGICGISAIIWGALLGGVFSISSIKPLWFNPLEEPVLMLAVSIIIGSVQMLTGYSLKTYKKIRDGKVIDGIFESVFIYTLFGSVACLALNMLLKPSGGTLSKVGMILMIVSLAGIVLTNGRNAKGIGGKIAIGLAGLYNLINLFSDVLSYARIFGLVLASAAIGVAFNSLGSMFFGSIPGYFIGGVLLVALHGFNLALGLLSAYVHNIRLQYLEFYGKFYDGGGRLFSPMGEKTKYVRFD